ncbi:uncharacterized protein LOC130548394 isoform X2 [Triplophysa rosa]|uniref:uncharacterized protein LOC130548394 isoform X2 n=1 Tax=Triplophysa rosa TaxID=992332 RepID=UPI00254624BC|nr:uncharacterized protein LOC130548394 isoform X2 [Triplophysa rosa]
MKMRNLLLPFGFLLFLNGVFAVDEVEAAVIKGDSLTLYIDAVETRKAADLLWTFNGDRAIIAKIDRETNTVSVAGNDDGRFRGRLKMDDQTGSLTITNIKDADAGLYQLQISSSTVKYKRFSVTVNEVNRISVNGHFVTLQTGVQMRTDDEILWNFQATLIANLTGPVDSRFMNSDVNRETGDLNITNIRSNQSGVYEMKINGRGLILHRTLCINVSGDVKSVPVKMGESVILHTATETQTDDVILWKFKDTVIAQFNRASNHVLYDGDDGRFRGRLQLDWVGSLTIRNVKTEDSGIYEVHVDRSKCIIHKIFRVVVKEIQCESQWKNFGLVVLGSVIGMIICFFLKKICS